jgi:hypothetical protein
VIRTVATFPKRVMENEKQCDRELIGRHLVRVAVRLSASLTGVFVFFFSPSNQIQGIMTDDGKIFSVSHPSNSLIISHSALHNFCC